MILINNKKTSYHICTSKNADECVRFAANELQKYLYKSTLCCIPLFSDKKEKRSKEILIGKDARDINQRVVSDLDGLSSEGYIIKEDNEELLLIGNTSRSTLYAVYRFLEELIGFRALAKDEEIYKEKNIIEFNNLYIKRDFSFEYREAYWTDAFDGEFASKNFLNSNLADISIRHGGRNKWYNFHHSFSDLVNPEEYFDTHPEYFSLIDGKRIKEHTELCLSNPNVFNIVVSKIKEWIKNNPECKIFSVAQDEWMGHFIKMACECENCKKIDDENESQSGSIITFVNKVADEIKKDYPDVLIHTFAYQYSRKPPKFVKPRDNVIVRLTNIECSWEKSLEEKAALDNQCEEANFIRYLDSWSKMTKRLYIWDYAVNYRNYLLPFPNLRSMAKNIELYRKYKVKGVLMQGNFSFGGGGYLDELKSYVTAKLLQDENYKLDDLVKEFCDGYYKEAGKYIYQYAFLFEDQIKNERMWLYDDADHTMFDEEIIKKASNLLNKALASVKNDTKYYKRVKRVSLGIDYLKIVRLPLDYIDRNKLIDEFEENVRKQGITELFERTNLDYSFNVMRNSRYAKDRPNWYSLYYIMR